MSIEQDRTEMFRNIRLVVKPNDTIRSGTPLNRNRAGWVLVGGQSSRMGADKATLAVDGIPLALRAAAEVAKVCDTVGLAGDPKRYGGLGFQVIPDGFPGCGPLAGIEAALSVTSADWNLITACDMPSLDVSFLESLFGFDADCVLPQYEDGRVEPLCAVYRRRCHPVILSALEAGIRKVTAALEPLRVEYVRAGSEAPFVNLNTPEDLRMHIERTRDA